MSVEDWEDDWGEEDRVDWDDWDDVEPDDWDQEEEQNELGLILEMQVQRLAATFYQIRGREFLPEHDFKGSTHPEEVQCWNMSLVAHAIINNDAGLLKFQTSSRQNMNKFFADRGE